MKEISEKEVIHLCGKIGQILLVSGAETPRVEETVEYIGKTANREISCYVTLNAVFIDAGSESLSHFQKARFGGFNLQKVDEINELSRNFAAGTVSFAELKIQVEEIAHQVIDFSWPIKLLGAGLVSLAPMMLFKASWLDLFFSFFIGMLGYVGAHYVGERTTTPYLKEASGGFIIAILALSITLAGLGENANNIILCSLMPLVPGVAITNSIREIIARHIISGIMRAVDATITAGAIVVGVVVATSLLTIIEKFLGG